MTITRTSGAALAGLALAFTLTACGGSDSAGTSAPQSSAPVATTTASAPGASVTRKPTAAPVAPSTTVIFGTTITSPVPGAPGSGPAAAGGDCTGFKGMRAEADQGGAPLWCTQTVKGLVWLAAQTPSNTHQPAITQGCGNAGDRERDVNTGAPLVCRAAPQYGGGLTWLASS